MEAGREEGYIHRDEAAIAQLLRDLPELRRHLGEYVIRRLAAVRLKSCIDLHKKSRDCGRE